MKTALTVAGSDSGGGAGIQADLKTFAALGVHGASAITAVTAQNSLGVAGILGLPPSFVEAQFDAVAGDLGVDAMKTGMLFNAGIVGAVSRKIREYGISRAVVDPVMVATSGELLLTGDAVEVLRTELLPLALVVTPNRREAEVLGGLEVRTDREVAEAARRISRLGPRYVLIKGGHAAGDPVDWLYDGRGMIPYHAPRIETPHTHGTGCTLSAAIVAYLALGRDVPEAVASAKEFITGAIRDAYSLGRGHGTLNQLFALHPMP